MYKRTRWGWVCLVLFIALCCWMLTGRFNLGIDLQGGTELSYKLDLSQIVENPEDVSNKVKDIISRRLDLYGLKEIRIAIEGQDRLIVTIPGADAESTKLIKTQIEKAGNLRLQVVETSNAPQGDIDRYLKEENEYLVAKTAWVKNYLAWQKRKKGNPSLTEKAPVEPTAPEFIYRHRWDRKDPNDPDGELSEEPERREALILINRPDSVIEGNLIQSAGATFDQNGRNAIAFTMRGPGATKLGDLTDAHQNERLAIVLDEQVISAPNIESRITTNGIITGQFTPQEVNGLVTILKGGSLPTKPLLLSENTVGSVFGEASIQSGFYAVMIGLSLVMLTMAVYYLFGGLVANFAVLFNVVAVLSYVVCFRQTLTLPGIAGILLTIGMAVDANILIFERVREERKRGKSLMQALSTGYQRAFSVIFDANLTTLITGVVLFNFGTGPIKGFAVTLIAGILISFVSALFVTRLILSTALKFGILKELKMLEAFDTPKISFSKIQKPFLIASVIIIIGSWALVIPRGKENYGIDFTGGARIGITLNKEWNREGIETLITTLEKEHPELFRSWSLQEHRIEGEDGRHFVLLTRAGEEGGKDEEEEAQDTGAALPEALGGTDAKKEAAQRVRAVLEKALDESGYLLPPPFGEPAWKSEAGGQSLTLAVNIVGSGGTEGLALRSELEADINAVFENDPTLAENSVRGTPAIRVKLGGVQFVKSSTDDANSVTTYSVAITPFEPSPVATTDLAAPTREQLENSLRKAFRDDSIKSKVVLSDPFPTVSTVGPVVAKNLQGKALVAFFIAILGIVFYVSLRFEFNFGIAAIAALVHDVMITIGIIALTDYFVGGVFSVKVNLPEVAALLTIVGYSINDTIVVFDRIRENLKIHGRKKMTFRDCVDLSINQTLSRTLWTSVTTLLTVCSLLFLGGEAVRGFAFTFLIGLIAGTYSSVFVASPILILLNDRAMRRREELAGQSA
jgi:SecD/SecF fusion protein